MTHNQQRDTQKQKVCFSDGITLIIIPYWWDQQVESVTRTIHRLRPDISLPAAFLTGDPIPTEEPQTLIHKGMKYVPKLCSSFCRVQMITCK